MGRGRKPKVADSDLLRKFVLSPEPVFTSKEISEEHDEITLETARNRLNDLVEKGYLDMKKPSSRVTLYWVTPEGKRFYEEEMG